MQSNRNTISACCFFLLLLVIHIVSGLDFNAEFMHVTAMYFNIVFHHHPHITQDCIWLKRRASYIFCVFFFVSAYVGMFDLVRHRISSFLELFELSLSLEFFFSEHQNHRHGHRNTFTFTFWDLIQAKMEYTS